MTVNTAYLSENTTHFTSNVTIDGALTVGGALGTGSTFSTGAITATTVTGTAGTFTSSLTVGVGGPPLLFIGGSKTSVAALTCTATKSTETTFTNNLAAVGDLVIWGMGTSTSSLSAGLALDTFVSAASTITIRFSNVSAANAAQPAISLSYALLRF